jgi:hypothetical protein
MRRATVLREDAGKADMEEPFRETWKAWQRG